MDKYDIWLSVVLGACCANGKEIIDCNIKPQILYENRADWSVYGCFTARQVKKAAKISLESLNEIYKLHSDNNIKSVNYTDEKFPSKFKNIPQAPIILFYKGNIEILSRPYIVALIGSRQCNGEGERAAQLISSDIAQSGGVVISGLAQGIDSIANKVCAANGSKTIAVLGVPVNEYYPKTNQKLQDLLAEEHLIISEYPCGQRYYSTSFVQRNRLIAAASDAICVIQAAHNSGSLITVNKAIEYEKPVFTVPGSIFSPFYEGSNELLAQGIANAVTNGKQIIEYLGGEITEKIEENENYDLDPMAKSVLDCIDGAMFTGNIIRKSKMGRGVVKAILTQLEIDGLICRTESGEYIRTK